MRILVFVVERRIQPDRFEHGIHGTPELRQMHARARVNMSDPSWNGGPAAGGANIRSMRSNPKFQSANKACSSYLAKAFSGAANPAQRAQFQQQLVKFAQCMRSHGIDIPDPTTSSGGGFGILRQISSSERNSPRFKSAMQACSSTLPNRGSRGATTTTTG